MQWKSFVALGRLPNFFGYMLAVLMLGLALSFAAPYLSLFGADEVGMSPLALGLFMTCTSVSSIVISTRLGRWSDRRASRRPLVLLAIVAAGVGYLLFSVTRNYLLLLVISSVFLGTGAAAFPQLFALARAQIGSGTLGDQASALLRSVFSLAWVGGPGIGALLLAGGGFRGLYLGTAACFAVAAVPVLLARVGQTPQAGGRAEPVMLEGAPPARPVWLVALSFVLYGTSMSMGAISLPIHVTHALHGTTANVGFLVGLCALAEIPIMLAFVLFPRRVQNERLIVLGFGLFVLYFVLVYVAPGMGLLIVAQLVRAVVIGIAACLGMAYFQDLMPGRFGAATTLFANTTNAGSMLAGLITGVVAQAFGYHAVFLVCAVLSITSWGLLLAVRRGFNVQPKQAAQLFRRRSRGT
ncbi:sugar efflux transporter [Deinococcus sonorensis]|uniref:Sugar efflux transporter n=2 Tax=Deinococcus sonorensis TaxID=309891 RepID=A0AAU7UHB6_9DEIO